MPTESEHVSDLLARQRIVDRFLDDSSEIGVLIDAINGQSRDARSEVPRMGLSEILQGMTNLVEGGASSDEVRAQAVAGLGQIARAARETGGTQLPDEIAGARSTVLGALRNANPEIRGNAARALIPFAPEFATEVVAALRETVLTDPVPEIVAILLKALVACGKLQASRAVSELITLLDQDEPETRLEVCRTLEWLEGLGAAAIPKLIEVSASPRESEDVRAAAARALAVVDPKGRHVMAAVGSLETLRGVVEAAQLASTGTEQLASILSQKLAHIETIGPLPGWMRASMAEMIRAVFGNVPAGEEDERQWLDTRDERLRAWMRERRLHALKIDRGVYHVHVGDFENVQRLVTDSRSQEPSAGLDEGHVDPQTS